MGSNPAAATSFRNFGNSVYPTLQVYFRGDTKSCRSLLSGVYTMEVKYPTSMHWKLVLVRYSIYRRIAILVNVRYRYLMVSRYYDISNDQTILGRYFVRSAVSSYSILKQPSIWKHCRKTSISRYLLLLIVRLSIHQTSTLVSSIVKRFL